MGSMAAPRTDRIALWVVVLAMGGVLLYVAAYLAVTAVTTDAIPEECRSLRYDFPAELESRCYPNR